MKVHPDIASLRSGNAVQRRDNAQKQLNLESVYRDWLALDQVHHIRDEMAQYAAGRELSDCSALAELVSDLSIANGFIQQVQAPFLQALQGKILGEVPFRYKASGGLAMIRLMEAGGATLSLAAYEPLDAMQEPKSALFSDRDVRELIVNGVGLAWRHRLDQSGQLQSEKLPLQAGQCLRQRANCETRQIVNVERSLLVLQLTREPVRPQPMREVDLSSSTVLRVASGDKSASQALMALSVLGALGSHASLNVMEHTAFHSGEDVDVRWEAVRQVLGLDAKRGLQVLGSLSERLDDPLAKPASSLRDQLLSARPELKNLSKELV